MNQTKKKWYLKNGWIIFFLFIFFPLGLVLMWKSGWKQKTKWIITGIVAFIILINSSSPDSTKKENSGPKPTPTISAERQQREEQRQAEKEKKEQEKREKEEAKKREEEQWISSTAQIYCDEHKEHTNLPDLSGSGFPDLSSKNSPGLTSEECEQTIKTCLEYWSKDECRQIAEGKAWLGMTSHQARLAFGNPNDINKTVTQYSELQQWIYGSVIYKTVYLYFERQGSDETLKLTSWQDF